MLVTSVCDIVGIPEPPPIPPPLSTPTETASSTPASSTERSALLGSIEGFNKSALKKAPTSDRSAPGI